MRSFFSVLFGGLFIVSIGIGIPYASGKLWQTLHGSDFLSSRLFLSAIAKAIPAPSDGTSILGFVRSIRYTATEEETLINNANQSLSKQSQGPITALSYIITDVSTNTIADEKDSERLLPIASLTKLVTAAVARKMIDPSEHINITQQIINTYGNTGQLKPGEVFRAADVYYPLLMVSSNDAAEALARSYGRKEFVKAMNDFTQSIGAYRTYFADPSGLSPLNESTAKDISIILNWIRNNDPEILAITMTKTKTVGSHVWDNPTHFLNWSNYSGGKNGFIPESNQTGAALFTLGTKKDIYAVVVLGSSFRDGDVLKLLAKVH